MIRLCGWGVEIGSVRRGEKRGKGRIRNRGWNEEGGEGGMREGGAVKGRIR